MSLNDSIFSFQHTLPNNGLNENWFRPSFRPIWTLSITGHIGSDCILRIALIYRRNTQKYFIQYRYRRTKTNVNTYGNGWLMVIGVHIVIASYFKGKLITGKRSDLDILSSQLKQTTQRYKAP